jgi:hypothetical protein
MPLMRTPWRRIGNTGQQKAQPLLAEYLDKFCACGAIYVRLQLTALSFNGLGRLQFTIDRNGKLCRPMLVDFLTAPQAGGIKFLSLRS